MRCERLTSRARSRRHSNVPVLKKSLLFSFFVLMSHYEKTKVESFTPLTQRRISSPIYYLNKDGSAMSDSKLKKKKTLKQIQSELKKQFIALEKFDQQELESQQPVFLDMESNILNGIWGSKSVLDVKAILDDVILTAKHIIRQVSNQEDDPDSTSELELLGPNIAAAALRRVLDLRPDYNKRIGGEEDVQMARDLVPRLLNVVGRQIISREGGEASSLSTQEAKYSFGGLMSSLTQLLGTSPSSIFRYEITSASKANYLCSLAKIELLQRRSRNANEKSKLAAIARTLCAQTLAGDYGQLFVQEVKPTLLLETLSSLATFDLKDDYIILDSIGHRLKQGDATGQLSGQQLSQGLWAYAVLNRPHLGLIKSFTRRLRKANIRKSLTPSDITRAIWSASQSLRQLDLLVQSEMTTDISIKADEMYVTDEEIALTREDIVVMIYTLSSELLESYTSGREDTPKLYRLNARQLADLSSALSVAEFESNANPIVNAIGKYVRSGNVLRGEVSATDLARILWSFQRLRLSSAEHKAVESVVQRFVELLELDNSRCSPKTLNTILRSVVLLVPDHGKSFHDLQQISSKILQNKTFLKKCNEFECSNFMFFFAMSNTYDKDVIRLLADRMSDNDIVSSCTPSSASRFLWSFTKLVESNEEDLHIKEILYEMFQNLGGILLSMQLTPVDASSAMWAIAKSSYSLDMGVFDHLAECLTQQCMMKRATIQQVTEALWSCGKIYNWDWEGREHGKTSAPPYVRSAKTFASFLVSQRSKMSPKDISQAILSLGYMRISDDYILKPLAYKAVEFADESKFNSQELANIVWALSKLNLEDEVVFLHLTSQLRSPHIMDQCTSQEAANVLYALGKMKIRDKDTFECMDEVLMRNLDGATTQAIANALWAHECVNLAPHRKLFDSWALEKLNIVGLYLDNDKKKSEQLETSTEETEED